jgi:hypothetical protein
MEFSQCILLNMSSEIMNFFVYSYLLGILIWLQTYFKCNVISAASKSTVKLTRSYEHRNYVFEFCVVYCFLVIRFCNCNVFLVISE